MSSEPEEISLKPEKSLTRADVEYMLQQQGNSETLNLSGLNLSIVDFGGMDLHGAAFAFAHLNGANLQNASLVGASFNSARLNGVKGYRANLNGTDLQNASLIEAKLEETSLRKAKLNEVNLSGATLRNSDLSEADLSGANLSEADLSGADLTRACLYQTNLSRAILLETNLSEADLRGAILGGAKLDGARLDKTNLSQVRLILVNLREAKMSQANLSQSDLGWSDLSGADLTGADLSGAKLIETELHGADLRDANLSGANFSGANLSGAKLIGANLGDANLAGANLAGAYISDEQKSLLEASGEVLGLDSTRSAEELAELEAPAEPPAELLPSHNGFVAADDLAGLVSELAPAERAAVRATGELPPLSPAQEAALQGQPQFAETALPPVATEASEAAQAETTAATTLRLSFKRENLGLADLVRLLAALEKVYNCLGLAEQGRFADLVEYYRSPDQRPEYSGSLGVRILAGQIELDAGENPPGAFLALNFLLDSIVHNRQQAHPAGQTVEFNPALPLAERVLGAFWPNLDANAVAMAAQTMLDYISQLVQGPEFVLGEQSTNLPDPGNGPTGAGPVPADD